MIEIEITESIGSLKTETLKNTMNVLRDQGFRFALDDLGSEYSSLGILSDLPFDTIKLDRLLIKRLTEDTVSRSIVEGVVQACAKNNICCIAEGIEQSESVNILKEAGCNLGQGYYFGRPMTVEQFTDEFLASESAYRADTTEEE